MDASIDAVTGESKDRGKPVTCHDSGVPAASTAPVRSFILFPNFDHLRKFFTIFFDLFRKFVLSSG